MLKETRRDINAKTAANVFVCLIFIIILLSLILDVAKLDTGNIWIQSCVILVQYSLFFGVFMLFSRMAGIKRGGAFDTYRVKKPSSFRDVFTVILTACICIVSFLLVTSISIEFFKWIGYSEPGGDIPITNFGTYVLFVFLLCVLPAIIEELLFRGIILKGLMEFGKIKAMVASAVLFSFFHLSPAQTVYQFVLGLVLAAVFFSSGNLVYSMILHFINNFAIITYTYITGDPAQSIMFNPWTILTTIFLAVFGVALIVGLVKALKRDTDFQFDKKKFFSFENLSYFVCLILATLIWGIQFVG